MTKSMNLLIYAANLHVGGGVQVATSVIDELSQISDDAVDFTVWVSSAVDVNLRQLNVNKAVFAKYEIIDHFGISAFWSREMVLEKAYDGVLVIFGPHYLGWLSVPIVVGFAQPWIIYNNSDAYKRIKSLKRIFLRVKYWLQGKLFRLADILLVELEHVRVGLISSGIASGDHIRVVHNCISSIYLEPGQWIPVELPYPRAAYRFGFLGRNYGHKNTEIFPEIISLLRYSYGLDVELIVTFTEKEWNDCSDKFRANVVNIGPLSVAQCPSFYKNLDGILFPSLLECFSATPLEAMAMRCMVFASDRSFVHDVCGEYADYFDPLDPASAAAMIAWRLGLPKDESRLDNAQIYARNFSNAKRRAREYIQCLKELVLERDMKPRRSEDV